jgi:nitrogen fixation NifU-like protein
MRELYQQVVLDHNRDPRNFRRLEPASHVAHGHNPLCGDKIDVYLDIDQGVVRDVAFEGDGCAISTASASIMTELLKGRPASQAQELFELFHRLVSEGGVKVPPEFEQLAVLAAVRQFPSRVKCATLPWHTLRAALCGETDATTEAKR